jgi:hypothetical protein
MAWIEAPFLVGNLLVACVVDQLPPVLILLHLACGRASHAAHHGDRVCVYHDVGYNTT